MDINKPITEDDELLFCEACNALALEFLGAAQYAVKFAGVEEASDLRMRVDVALAALLGRRDACPDCNED